MSHLIDVDVAIIGGGAAGVSAAIASAKEGATVLLLERNSFLGGKATAASVGTICGLYLRSNDTDSRYINTGFVKEFAERLKTKGNTMPYFYKEGLHFLPYDPFHFKILCDEMILENKVKLFLHTTCISVVKNQNKIEGIEVFAGNRKLNITARAFVDSSGEAVINQLSDGELISSKEQQTSAQVFSLEGVEETNEQKLILGLIRRIGKGIETGALPPNFERISIVPGSLQNGRVLLKLSIPKRVSGDINNLTDLELFSRKAVSELSKYLVANMTSLKNGHIGYVAPEVGTRTGKRPMGKYVLSEEDVMECRKFKDGIANGSWPVEFWNLDKKPLLKYFPLDDYYQIPADCLRSKFFSNLFYAGRNISATDEAIASARVIGTCLQTGWAAGLLATHHAHEKDQNKAIKMIQEHLKV
ncbi:MAG TPA: FAD-dependent oxidoreductase [Cytophagales bacterium]|nr:FAD-dependent oxidoreductase [Cytophagales bacterium]